MEKAKRFPRKKEGTARSNPGDSREPLASLYSREFSRIPKAIGGERWRKGEARRSRIGAIRIARVSRRAPNTRLASPPRLTSGGRKYTVLGEEKIRAPFSHEIKGNESVVRRGKKEERRDGDKKRGCGSILPAQIGEPRRKGSKERVEEF